MKNLISKVLTFIIILWCIAFVLLLNKNKILDLINNEKQDKIISENLNSDNSVSIITDTDTNSDTEEIQSKIDNEEKVVKILAAGDVIPHKGVLYDAKQSDGSYDFTKQFEFVKKYISNADISIVNLETATKENAKFSGYPRFNAPKDLIKSLKEVGFDVIGTANNHMLDMRKQGFIETVEEINNNDLIQVGGNINNGDKNYRIVEKNGLKIGITAYTYSYNGLEKGYEANDSILSIINMDNISKDFKELKNEGTDFNIIFLHWGNEYSVKTNNEQKNLAIELSKLGYDIIIGSHPHVVQTFEMIKVKNKEIPVIYSLGNFISNQRHEDLGTQRVENGLIFTCELSKIGNNTSIKNIEFIPTWVSKRRAGNYRIIPTTEALSNQIKYEFTENEMKKIKNSYEDTMSIIGL